MKYFCFPQSNPVLKLLAKELAPAYFRVGGTKSNFLIFCDDEEVCEDGQGYSNITLSGTVLTAQLAT